jgi:hypothetical protein
MPEITTERAPEAQTDDREILRRAGIVPNLSPGLPLWRKVLLGLALLLAGSTALFAGLFQAGAPSAGGGFTDCSTQCPMGARPNAPGK